MFRAEAVTRATPKVPGVQMVYVLSHSPAHATPVGETVKTEELSVFQVNATPTLLFVPFCAVAVKESVFPACREALVPGVRLMRVG